MKMPETVAHDVSAGPYLHACRAGWIENEKLDRHGIGIDARQSIGENALHHDVGIKFILGHDLADSPVGAIGVDRDSVCTTASDDSAEVAGGDGVRVVHEGSGSGERASRWQRGDSYRSGFK